MKKNAFVLVGALFLVGCAAPHPLAKVSNLSDKTLGEVMHLLDLKKEHISFNETKDFRHWKFWWSWVFSDSKFVEQNVNKRLSNFDQYCNALGGKLSSPEGRYELLSAHETPQVVADVSCENKETKAAIFRVHAITSNCSNMSTLDSNYSSEFPYSCNVVFDAFDWKPSANSSFDSLSKDYLLFSGFSGFMSARVVNEEHEKYKQKRFERTQELRAGADRFMAEYKAKVIRDQSLVNKTGQRICKVYQIDQRKLMGHVLGSRIYSDPTVAYAKVAAFTEQSSGSRIQIRISGIQANGENLDRIDGDVVLTNGAVIWDEAKNWELCD